MKEKQMITQEYLKELLQYNENTGIFTWKINKANYIKIGSIAGCLDTTNYIRIRISDKKYLAHRLAWLYIYGEWPKKHIDHINGIKNDNRIINLRDVSQRQNCQNQNNHRNGKLVGCHFNKKADKWISQIKINGKAKHLGIFNTELEAHEAYSRAIRSK